MPLNIYLSHLIETASKPTAGRVVRLKLSAGSIGYRKWLCIEWPMFQVECTIRSLPRGSLERRQYALKSN